MKSLLSCGWSSLLILLGTGPLSWIGYNLLVEMQPSAEGRSPTAPTIFAVSMIAVGFARMRKAREAKNKS